MLWVDSESLWVPRPAPLTNTLPAPTGETVSRLIKPTPSTGDTWPEGFPSKRKTMSPAWPRKVLQAFLFVPKSSNSVSPAPSHTPEPGCSVPGSEQEERGQRAPPPHPLPPPHTCTRWAGPRADPQSHLLLILGVVSVTARILVLLPVLAVLAGGEEHDVLPVMDVI